MEIPLQSFGAVDGFSLDKYIQVKRSHDAQLLSAVNYLAVQVTVKQVSSGLCECRSYFHAF